MSYTTLKVSDAVQKRLYELRDETKAASIDVVFTRAFALYDMLVEMMKDGSKLFLRSADGTETEVKIQ